MWKRLTRKIRPYIDSLSTADNSGKILEQNLREMNEQVPGLDQNIALIKANITLLEKDLDRLIKDETSLLSRARAAIKAERDDLAVNFATTLEAVHSSKVNTIGQLTIARTAYDKALEVKKIFIREKERNFQDGIQVVRANQRARWQKIVADALERFEAADIDSPSVPT